MLHHATNHKSIRSSLLFAGLLLLSLGFCQAQNSAPAMIETAVTGTTIGGYVNSSSSWNTGAESTPQDAFPTHTLTLPPGTSFIANPLAMNDNRVARLFPSLPIGTTLSKYDAQTGKYRVNVFGVTGWSRPNDTLTAGDGATLFNPTRRTLTVTLRADMPDWGGAPTLNVSSRMTLVSSAGIHFDFAPGGSATIDGPWLIPAMTGVTISFNDLGAYFNPEDGDKVWTYDRNTQRLVKHTYSGTQGWDTLPVVGTAESFFIQTRRARRIESWYTISYTYPDYTFYYGIYWPGTLPPLAVYTPVVSGPGAVLITLGGFPTIPPGINFNTVYSNTLSGW